jgi:hypothetical protein
MNAFAKPEEAFSYQFPEFPKPDHQVTEYANVEGAVEYQLRDFTTAEPYIASDEAAIVQPAIFQDFKEVIAAAQA